MDWCERMLSDHETCHSLLSGQVCLEDHAIHVSGHIVPHYVVLVLGFIGAILLLRVPLKGILVQRPGHLGSLKEKQRNITLVAFWAATLLASCFVWMSSVYWSASSGYMKTARVVVAVLVLPSILIIEGLGLAVLELEDKEIQEQVGRLSTRQVYDIMQDYLQAPELYLKAREWCLAGLIIVLTTAAEFEKYHIPYVGTVEGSLARISMTIFLAVVAAIWIAQAPGKELGREYPVKFLNMKIGPVRFHKIIMRLSEFAQKTSINDPSDVTAGFLAGLLPIAGEPTLSPGGARFFAELIRRYGYGDCEVNEVYTLNNDGSAHLVQVEKAYLGKGSEGAYVRLLVCDEEFLHKPEVKSYKAYVVPALSASLERDIEAWNKGQNIISHVRQRNIKVDVDYASNLIDENGKPEYRARITAKLPPDMLEEGQGYVLEIETHTTLPPGAFKGPELLGKDYWSRTLSKPCYRATTLLKLADTSDSAAFESVTFEATSEENGQRAIHVPESLRFQGLQREEDLKRGIQGTRMENGVPEDGRSLFVKLTFGVPMIRYTARWNLTDGMCYLDKQTGPQNGGPSAPRQP